MWNLVHINIDGHASLDDTEYASSRLNRSLREVEENVNITYNNEWETESELNSRSSARNFLTKRKVDYLTNMLYPLDLCVSLLAGRQAPFIFMEDGSVIMN